MDTDVVLDVNAGSRYVNDDEDPTTPTRGAAASRSRGSPLGGEWPDSSGPQVFTRFVNSAVGPSMAEVQEVEVRAGVRGNGTLLVHMEALPQKDRMQLPGRVRRGVFWWDPSADKPVSLGAWECDPNECPQEYRFEEETVADLG